MEFSQETLTIFEQIATITGIICVFLQTKENVMAWPFGIVSVSLLIIVFFQANLLSDFILHIILLFLNIYGWIHWFKKSDNEEDKPILSFTKQEKIYVPLFILVGSFAWGTFMNKIFNASLAYVDAFTSVGSLVAQYFLAKKVIENWIIWIIVDVIAIGVYLYKDLYYTSFLFFVFLLLCIKGYFDWKKKDEIATLNLKNNN